MKRIAVDLAKSVYQVAESVRAGAVSQHRRLSREAFGRYIQEQAEPVEWLMEACTPERLTCLQQWALATAERIGQNKAAVALANKLVRICWAVWCHERRFSGDWHSARPA
ncbi:hypothetical protein HP532_18980 [Pseudomonas sp. CrR25]|nr:hypothetical protein [Pseudomonas sp. CrR25]